MDSDLLNSSLSVRPATTADARAIADVAFETAFFGASAAAFFPCPELFGELWVQPYLHAGHGHVAVTQAGKVVGYCVGVDQPTDYARGLLARLPRTVAALARCGCSPGWRTALKYGWRALRFRTPAAPARIYPAHLHLALLPASRGGGAGRALLSAFLTAAAGRGVQGLQLSTTAGHVAAVNLYLSSGFEQWAAGASPLWRPWTGHDETHLTLVTALGTGSRPVSG